MTCGVGRGFEYLRYKNKNTYYLDTIYHVDVVSCSLRVFVRNLKYIYCNLIKFAKDSEHSE